jgi:NitT/TauT family transport system ATP-binding protein
MILGLDPGFDGHVKVAGDGRVAAVFQEPRLLPWRTVEQNVRLALPRHEASRSLDELFAALGLASHRELLPGELSLGLARRVALARAFALEPSLIVLDEPFVSLDESTAARLRDLLLSVWRARPTTILMVTHDLDEAVSLADRVLMFSAAPATISASLDFDTARDLRDEPWRRAATERLRSRVQPQ